MNKLNSYGQQSLCFIEIMRRWTMSSLSSIIECYRIDTNVSLQFVFPRVKNVYSSISILLNVLSAKRKLMYALQSIWLTSVCIFCTGVSRNVFTYQNKNTIKGTFICRMVVLISYLFDLYVRLLAKCISWKWWTK